MRDYRNLGAIIFALSLMQVAGGALAIAVPLALEAHGEGPFNIGVVAAFYAIGLMGGALAAPRLISAIGHIRAFAFFAAIAAALTLALYFRIDVLAWSLVRMGLGACAAGIFTAGESWIATEAPKQRRGALMGFYHVVSKIALIGGALIIAEIDLVDEARAVIGLQPIAPAPFMIAGAIFALCLAPVAATRKAAPAPPSTEPFAPRALVQNAPAAFVACAQACAAAGLINGAVSGLSPVYAAPSDPSNPNLAAALFYGAFMIGGVVSQFPAGALSDRVDRRLVIGALAATSAAASFALALLPPEAPRALQLLFALAWGAGALSYYGVAVAHAVDRVSPSMHARAIAGLLVVWALGNIVGPLIAGYVMQSVGPSGLFVYAGIGSLLLAAAMVRRSTRRDATPTEEREPFVTVQASSLASAELDPRGAKGGEAAPADAWARVEARDAGE